MHQGEWDLTGWNGGGHGGWWGQGRNGGSGEWLCGVGLLKIKNTQ